MRAAFVKNFLLLDCQVDAVPFRSRRSSSVPNAVDTDVIQASRRQKEIKSQVSALRERSRVITLMMEDCAELCRKKKANRLHRNSEPSIVLEIIDRSSSQIIMVSLRVIVICLILLTIKYCLLYD
ncbi:hypothetical protein BSL78_08705 [Apostichopus japonicus]|uniref:Uncharacterized protein n=1 Tax=Stichopus japonicus TaxID=307972 RepID=A0A2G8L2A7_STIJA|nr:hypothetical protein BSL78_08705 [Apostichopus japonicus]